MYHYVYKITDKRTGMYYIGARSSEDKPEEDLGIIYFGSAANSNFKKAQKETPEMFSYEVLKEFDCRTDAFGYESELIEEAKKDPESYNGGVHFLPPVLPLGYTSRKVIEYFGQLIRTARKERGMTEAELADRMGVSRSTLRRIQDGDPGAAIGSYMEAAIILGIPVMGGDKENIRNMTTLLSYMNKLLPERAQGKVIEVDDDF